MMLRLHGYTICLLSIYQRIISSTEIPIFVRQDDCREILSLDVRSNTTAAELYEIVPNIGFDDVLSHSGLIVDRSDTREIADLSICPETVLHLTQKLVTDAEALYRLAKDWTNNKVLPWWGAAERCHASPATKECEQHMICQWSDIQCDSNNKTIAMVLNIASHGFSLHRRMDMMLSGKLVLHRLPRTVSILEASLSDFNEVDWSGLRFHDLRTIDLASNRVTDLKFGDLKDSSVARLDLEANGITKIILAELEGSSMTGLFLNQNNIAEIDFNGLNKTKLRHLDLQNNQLSAISFEGLAGSPLRSLNLYGNPMTMVDFKGISHSSLRSLLILPSRPNFKARNVEELKTSLIEKSNIELILGLIEENNSDMMYDA